MRITRQDLASPARPTPSPQLTPPRPRRQSPPATITMISVLLVAAFASGALAQARGGMTLLAAAENPRFQIASILRQSNLPRLYLDVEFKDAQRLKADRQSAQAAGVHLARPNEAVTATVRLGDDNIVAQIQLPAGPYDLIAIGNPQSATPALRAGASVRNPKSTDAWAFEIATQDERGVLGLPHLMLYEAASRRALSQWGLSESLRREGILSAPVQPVQVVLNGDALGVYGAWAAPEELVTQSRLSSGLVYFDQTLYWRDLLRQRGNGPAPTSVNLSDCRAATAAVAPASAHNADAALARLRALQTGSRKPSDVLDVEQMGMFLALISLWQGAPLDDWSRLMFYLDASTDRLRPAVVANLISTPGEGALRWPACFDDPVLQAAYVRAIERISQPDYLDELRAALGNFDQMQLAFTARGGTLRAELTWGELAARQARMARWLEPTQTVLALWRGSAPPTTSLTPLSTLSVSLSNLQRVPVEVLGFDVGKSTFLPVDPAWIQDGADLIVSSSKDSLVLRAADEGRLRSLRLNVPYTAVFAAARSHDETVEMQVVTRMWGLARRQSAPVQPVGGE